MFVWLYMSFYFKQKKLGQIITGSVSKKKILAFAISTSGLSRVNVILFQT